MAIDLDEVTDKPYPEDRVSCQPTPAYSSDSGLHPGKVGEGSAEAFVIPAPSLERDGLDLILERLSFLFANTWDAALTELVDRTFPNRALFAFHKQWIQSTCSATRSAHPFFEVVSNWRTLTTSLKSCLTSGYSPCSRFKRESQCLQRPFSKSHVV